MTKNFALFCFEVELQCDVRTALVEKLGKDSRLVVNDANVRQSLTQLEAAIHKDEIDKLALERLFLGNVLLATGIGIRASISESHNAKLADFYQKCAELEAARSGLY